MENYMYLVPVAAVIALIFAAYLARKVGRQSAGTERMKEIAAAIAEGARAFLTAEYKILIIFVAVLFVLIGIGIGNWVTAICFVVGALFSTVAGYCGMTVATKANVRTANAAKESGMNKALSIAFSGGAVMGMCVAGLGALGVSLVYIVTRNVDVLFGFSLGASSIALFARVGGGIYTKAADVGADLVGKVEAGIPEDDPRNPAVIADNVGDNVGDVAGMGADLFESYCGSLISALTLGVAVSEVSGVLFPLAIAGCGLIASMIGTFFVRGGENANPQKALTKGSYAASVLVMIASLALSRTLFGNMNAAIAVIAGLIVGVIIACYVIFSTMKSRANKAKKGYRQNTAASDYSRAAVIAVVILWYCYKLYQYKGISVMLVWVVAICMIYNFITSKTAFGRYFYAIGGNEKATQLSGIDTNKVYFIAYANMGLLAGLAGLLCAARVGSVNGSTGTSFEMDAIGSCFIGGASAYGGSGTVGGVVIGALLLGVINMGMSIMGIGDSWQYVVKGAVLLIAVVFDVISNRKSN